MQTTAKTTSPTGKQLSYLRVLAARTGTTFAPPRTRGEASGEIARLKRILDTSGVYEELPQDEPEASHRYATAPAREEVDGRGADASWRAAPPASLVPKRSKTKRAVVGRYEAHGQQRLVCAERTDDGPVRLVDRPAGDGGRVHLIDADLAQDGADALRALVTDYVGCARRLGGIPMQRLGWG